MRWITRIVATAVLATSLAAVAAAPAGAATELVVNGTFAAGTTPWWNSGNTAATVANGQLRIDVTGGTANPWDAMIGHRNVPLTQGRSYTLSFDAAASATVTALTTVQGGTAPYPHALMQSLALTTASRRFSYTFTSTVTDPAGEITFQFGAGPGYAFFLDNVSLLDNSGGGAGNPIDMTSGFYVDPHSNPAAWVAANPGDGRASQIQASIASKPMARWFGNWSGDITTAVSNFVGAADAADKLPVLVAYNIPGRDACGGHSGGGAGSEPAYNTWIAAFAAAIGARPAVVVIEPDSLADFNCMQPDAIAARNRMINYASQQLRDHAPNTWAYLDAGNAGWVPAATMAQRLHDAGVANVRGFSINVSNYYTTAQSTGYGNDVNANLPGYTKGFVVDTSRNGNGSNGEWCNPAGRKLGATAQVGGGADMLLWVKVPGDSDGPCGIAPGIPAGQFSPDIAMRLITGT